jgi:hypothetical protein
MRHDRRVEERGGLGRIFVRKKGANERLPFWRCSAVVSVALDLFEAFAKKNVDILMPILEFAVNLRQ